MTKGQANQIISGAAKDTEVRCPKCGSSWFATYPGSGRRYCKDEYQLRCRHEGPPDNFDTAPQYHLRLAHLLTTLQDLGVEIVDLSVSAKVASCIVAHREKGSQTVLVQDVKKLAAGIAKTAAEMIKK